MAVIQNVVWAVSVVLMAVVVAVFCWVAVSARAPSGNYGRWHHAAYRFRGWLFVAMVLVIVVANYHSLMALPYIADARARDANAGPVQKVSAVGEQWDWSITPDHVVVGRPVEFHVTSKDVNHGFAIYTPALRIVAEVQAMPGYDNVLSHTFDTPGTYEIMCLEYCGLAHHEMTAQLKVEAR
jgi:cytochrome c oxidase subunit 2